MPSAAMAKILGIHPQTLRKLRRHQITPFKEGRDYRWVGLSTSSTLQWHVHSACRSYTEFQRLPAEKVETYSRATRVRAGS
ncbi:helix-turn-helix domain-containing protein [Synechococcus sp. BMK-MC-1]|uniref:helix-turn-helix domain-containing protein n=1 Tax=Synechococcus sp. BMK-MC-1 TaxID=1442551 RepID=UPI0016471A70|nr:helix-turn-helix domain-containing protein [Synechococcus sp. BMK-MC-1]